MSACKLHGEYACGKCMIVRNSLPERRFDTSPIYYEQKIGELHDRIAALERDLAAAQAERDALRKRANALLHQIDIGDYVDSEGHALKNNIAVLTLMKALTNV